MIVPALVAAVALYVVVVGVVAVLAARARRATRREPQVPDSALPRLVVLVPARDEEAHLPRCLDALLAQDYPADRLEIVVADDHSTDGTASVVRRYQAAQASETGAARPTLRLVEVPDGGPLRGKPAALDAAFAATDAPLVLLTDADCAPPPRWCRTMAAWLLEPDVGLVCGRTTVALPAGRGRALARAQALDLTYLLTAGAALTEAGLPATAMGNDMGIRRAAYDAVGGYQSLPFSVTEDHALFHAVANCPPWRVRFPLQPEIAVETLPQPTVGAVYGQRRRWARGGLRAGPTLWALYTATHLGHLAPLVALALAAAGVVPVALAVGLLAAKVGIDVALFVAAWGPGERGPLRGLAAGEALLFLYFSTLPLALLVAPRIRWKGRVH